MPRQIDHRDIQTACLVIMARGETADNQTIIDEAKNIKGFVGAYDTAQDDVVSSAVVKGTAYRKLRNGQWQVFDGGTWTDTEKPSNVDA